uniref:Slc35e1 n=1 Tax=Schmidtea mediterranea TaxID=79327 RepID=A0A0H3YFA1_SCHMD|nr:slc35e1 [Schmidtea mediterranea]
MKNALLPIRRSRTISDSESTELPDFVSTVNSFNSNLGEDNINIVTALVLCTIWCIISVLNNIISKSLLNNFPYPLTSTLAQLLATAICAYPLVKIWKIPEINWKDISYKYIVKMIIPLGFGKFMAACGTHISVSKLPVSYAHTVKASMPIFVVIFSYLFYKEKYSLKIYISLSVIFSGIALASITEMSFNSVGLLSAVIATASFAFLNILTKRCLNVTHMHQFSLLLLLARISTLMFLPIWIFNDGLVFLYSETKHSKLDLSITISLLIADGILNFAQNVIAFTLIAKITPLSYAVCNVIKRLVVIVMSILFFGNPVTVLNMIGTGASMGGVLMYNMTKMKGKATTILPIHKTKLNGSIVHNSRLPHIDSNVVLCIPNGLTEEPYLRKPEKRFHNAIDII